jgi:hypothetical protein
MLGYSDVTSNFKPDKPFNPPESPYFGDQAPIFQSVRGSVRDGDEIAAASLQSNRGAYMRRAMSFTTPRSLAAQNNVDAIGPNNAFDGNKQSLFSQKWQKAQEEMESMSVQNEDPGCAQQ